MERRHLSSPSSSVRVHRSADGQAKIAGYAAVFYDQADPGTEYPLWEDLVERIMPGAFDRALRDKDDCRALFNHDRNCLLGRLSAGTLELRADRKGLWYEIMPLETSLAADVIANIHAGNLTGSSFNFLPIDVTWVEDGQRVIREVNSVQLFDVGPVTFPAYAATTTGMRASGDLESVCKSFEQFRGQPSLDARLAAYRARLVELELRSLSPAFSELQEIR